MIGARGESHPVWPPLLAHRFEAEGDGSQEPSPEVWAEAMAHFDVCAECRRIAIAIDPTLGFRRLPSAVAEMSVAQEADEVARMISAVSALRAERRVTRRSERTPWARWSAAAALVLASLWVGSLGDGAPRAGAGPGSRAFEAEALSSAATTLPASIDPESSNGFSSRIGLAVEGVDRPDARVYQYDGDQLSVVMIVDESLDV